MWDTSSRLLRLLALLQSRREWTGAELADRLSVSIRTIRADVERLRRLGYPVDATRGAAGGYRLGAGGSLPPLLLDEEEAVAVTVTLRAAASAGGGLTGIEETALRALAKLEQVLPPRLRQRVGGLPGQLVSVPPDQAGPQVDPSVLTALATACRDTEQLRLDYVDHRGGATVRRVEPYRLVTWGRRWYLLAFDLDRDDWRTFRVDRITPRTPSGPRFVPRWLPAADVAGWVSQRVSAAAWRFRAEVLVHAPAERVRGRISPAVGTVVEAGPDRCTLVTGADTIESLAVHLGLLGHDFTVIDSPELVAELRRTADRYQRALSGSEQGRS